MENERKNIKPSKSNEQTKSQSQPTISNDKYMEQRREGAYNPSTSKGNSKNKHRFWIGLTALIALGTFIAFNGTTPQIEDVQSNGIGKGMNAGTKLAATDESAALEARDFEVMMKKDITTSRMLIWDFAAEDGDFVTVKVNGEILATNTGIRNKPIALNIPVPSVVEVIGIKDGGGGITYGVKFPGAAKNSAYFNAAPVSSSNMYTITGQ